jgi:hypothetical protein
MADEPFTTQRVLALRKITRTVADLMRGELREYLTTLAPLFRPRAVLGHYVESGFKEPVKGADAVFKEFQALFHSLAIAKPYSLPQEELRAPIEIISSVVEITPVEYAHVIQTERQTKTLTVTKPLQWILNYSGFSARRLQDLLADRNRSQNDVRAFLLHYLSLHFVASRQAGLAKILDALHFSLSTGRLPGCGELPITYVSALATTLPPDALVLESTELSGRDVFEELVPENALAEWKDRLRELVAGLM